MKIFGIMAISLLAVLAIVKVAFGGSLWTALFPPTDLYDPLVLEPIDLKDVGKVYSFYFKNKYDGTHSIALLIEDGSKIGVTYKSQQLGLDVKFYSELGELLLSTPYISENTDPFWSDNASGLEFYRYKSPNELPLHEAINVKISILADNSNFLEKYGDVNFLISKISDK